ncbi:MAG TPA: hypothetical protein PLA50_18385 [Bacteroidia bacterium]|nr:hypothetical protein [Bacteroidia bacterium]
MFRYLKWFLHGGEFKFSPLERHVLAKVRDAIPNEWLAAFDDQISHLDHLQRNDGNRFSTYWYKRRKKRLLLPIEDSTCIGRVHVICDGEKFRFKLYAVNGVLFDLECPKEVPKKVFKSVPDSVYFDFNIEHDNETLLKIRDEIEHEGRW